VRWRAKLYTFRVSAMKPSDVTLGDWARRLCAKFGIPEKDIQQARAGSTSCIEKPDWLFCYGDLPEGRVRMSCPHHMPHHVVSFRPLDTD
jgi:hypothetical protein